jgi:hypothetical protein
MKKAVLITTDKRGVFMGYIDPKDIKETQLTATDVRMCVKWSEDVKGVVGLAANGPSKNCRITAAAPKAVLHGVHAILEITKKAEKEWKKEHWAK